MCIHTLGHTTIYNLKKKKKLRLSLNLRKCFILPMSTNFCQLLNEQTNEQLKLCLSQHHAARIIWQYFLLWWTFWTHYCKKNFVENFPQKGGTKNCIRQCHVDIWSTQDFLILFFVFFLLLIFFIYMKPLGPKFNIRLPWLLNHKNQLQCWSTQ